MRFKNRKSSILQGVCHIQYKISKQLHCNVQAIHKVKTIEEGLCKVRVKCNLKTKEERFYTVQATCNVKTAKQDCAR